MISLSWYLFNWLDIALRLLKFLELCLYLYMFFLLQVRVTASWAMANICDSIRHTVSDSSLGRLVRFINLSYDRSFATFRMVDVELRLKCVQLCVILSF